MRYCWSCLALVAILGCTAQKQVISETAMSETVRQQLAVETPDSDAAIILSQAIEEARSAKPGKQTDILDRALQQADEARNFSPHLEAPLPDGWPRPSLPGLIRIKSYPAVRAAWVRGPSSNNRQFMTLFRHIQDHQIAMTGPVVMGYGGDATKKPAESPDSMAFLYRQINQDSKGTFGKVQVEDEVSLTAVSMALTGSYREKNFQTAAANLREWLQLHKEWEPVGPVRVLAYNSPFMLFWRKYSEVQIPVRAAASQRSNTTPLNEAPPTSTSSLSGNGPPHATVHPMVAAMSKEEQVALVHGPADVHCDLLRVPK